MSHSVREFEELLKNFNTTQIIGAVVSVSAIFAVNLYGYLSVLPNGMMAIIGPEFIFNYSLQLSMSLALASLIGWQLGDMTSWLAGLISRISKKETLRTAFFGFILWVVSLDFLGKSKHLTLRYLFSILGFCFLFSGFEILVAFLFVVELLIIWIAANLYLNHRLEAEIPLPIGSWLREFLDELLEADWKRRDLVAFVPIAIFFSLLFSKELGEARAERVLSIEPIYLAQHDLDAIPFATSNSGLILAISDDERDKDDKPRFIIIGGSGEVILRSFRE